ncbi:MAG: cation:proton antiporter [Leptolyngbya sp. SIO1E4]|nr:cation:proton antiporter [Leptolyngbya sp. SIO1E4]
MIFSTIDFIYPVLAEAALADETVIFSALLISALVIFLTSQLLGELCAWLKLPPVLGQLVGGIILGVSVLKILVLAESDAAINPSIIDLICWTTGASVAEAATAYHHQLIGISEGAANLGVIALLFLIGLESDFESLLKVGPKAAIVAIAGVALPFIGGTVGLITLFGTPLLPAIFGGAALTATSIGITAKVLKELGQVQSEEGQIIIGAAVLDDLLGILVLALVVSLVKEGSINVADLGLLLLSTTAFVAGVALLRMPIIRAFTAITHKLQSEDTLLISAIVFALFMAAIANAIHLEAILGAFAAGVILSGMPQRPHLLEKFEPIAGLLAPLFFIVVGAKTDLSVLNPANPSSAEGLLIASFLILVAVVGKVAAGYFIPSSDDLNRLAIGLGMVPRGEVGLVFVGIGSSIGILSAALAAAVVLMVVVTTLVAPLLLRFALPEAATSAPIAAKPLAEG